MEIEVYDHQGNPRDLVWLREKYGDVIIQDAVGGAGPVFKISALREKVDTAATLVVTVLDDQGDPIEGQRVAWYWPDADVDPNAGPQGGVLPQMRPDRAVSGATNMNGDVGFGMGRGAYYWPDRGQIGPHATWIYGTETRSDLIFGLGMIAATNHDHFDIQYTRLAEGEPPPPTPPTPPTPPPTPPPAPGECPVEEIEAELAKIEQALQAIRDLLAIT
ncbi:MAG: hypothetical protein P8129_25130 [Anaerolineae bacterium]